MTKSASPIRSALLRSCAPTAFSMAVLATPQAASAQAFQATPSVVQGAVSIDRSTPNIDEILVDGLDAVIDWAPDEISGFPLTFLPSGNTAIFRGTPGQPTFAVLNRIQPTAIQSPAEFAGTVQSFIQATVGGPVTPGGFVAFYSPTGILVSGTAVFEVPQLMLTTNDVDIASFTDFANGTGPLLLAGASSQIDIQAGASLTGTPEGSFFIVSSSNINMAGDAYFNGSTAYVGAVEAQLTHSSGLFDIVIPFFGGVISSASKSITHTGSTGGPEPTGPGDNQIIYAVTRAQSSSTTGVAMLFDGNLGFDPAVSATVAGGEIILAANYDVRGRTVDGGTANGADSIFDGRGAIPFETGDIILDGVNATSNVTALSTHQTIIGTQLGSSTFAGDLVAVGRSEAILNAGIGGSVSVGGELYLSANNFGSDFNSIPAPVTGGFAGILSEIDGQVIIGGRSTVTAAGYAEVDFSGTFLGQATGGQAQVLADGGTISLGGNIAVLAQGRPLDQGGVYDFAETYQGGLAEFRATNSGFISLDGGLDIFAGGFSPNLTGVNASIPGDSTGGTVLIEALTDSGIDITNGFIFADASGGVGSGFASNGTGGTGQGDITNEFIFADTVGSGFASNGTSGTGQGDITNEFIFADTVGSGFASNGTGGTGQGGSVTVSAVPGSSFSVQGGTFLFANGFGGSVVGGGDGGLGIGGTINVLADGDMLFDGPLDLDTYALGGSGQIGGSGTGGTNTIAANAATITINSLSQSFAIGEGGASNGTGNGGDGIGGTAQTLITQGGQLLMTADDMLLNVDAFGGSSISGTGGNALSGDGLVLFDGSVGDFQAGLLFSGIGTGGDSQDGAGGVGASSLNTLVLQVTGGSTVDIVGVLSQSARGVGGDGVTGGDGNGGAAGFIVDPGATLNLHNTNLNAEGIGGSGNAGNGGDGFGGLISGDVNGTVTASADQIYIATGEGGASTGGTGGAGNGGTAQLNNQGGVFNAPTVTMAIDTGGRGGDGLASGDNGGNGTGGDSTVFTMAGAQNTFDRINLESAGTGGDSPDTQAGNGQGGQSAIATQGAGSLLSVGADIAISAVGGGGDILDTGGTGGEGQGGNALAITDTSGTVQAGAITDLDASGDGGGGQIAGDGVGGTAAISALTNGSITTGGAIVLAEGVGADGGAGGTGVGGIAGISADTGTVDLAGAALFSVGGFGGEDFGSSGAATPSGGDGSGGDVIIQLINGSSLTVDFTLETLAGGFGAASVDGTGGSAFGGIARFEALSGSVAAIDGALQQEVSASGGISSNSVGGLATGGASKIDISGAQSELTVGSISIFGTGIGADGGGAEGASSSIIVDAGGNLAVSLFTLIDLGAEGGDDGGNGFGGDASGGDMFLEVADSTASFGGDFEARFDANGGDAADGGNAFGGNGSLAFTNSTVSLGGRILYEATGRGGSAGTGAAPLVGGSGTGGTVTFSITDSVVTSAPGEGALTLSAEGQGVGSASGTGGDGQGGIATLSIANSNVDIDGIDLFTLSVSGGSNTQDGGTATGGTNSISILNSTVSAFDIFMENAATGNGAPPGGDATTGDQSFLIDNSTFSANRLFIFGEAYARPPGATATGGNINFIAQNGSVVTFANQVEAYASAYAQDNNGTALSGNVTLSVQSGSTIDFGSALEMYAEAYAGNQTGSSTAGSANAGNTTLVVDGPGSSVSTGTFISMISLAQGYTGIGATGGDATINVTNGGDLSSIAGITLIADAQSENGNAAGSFDLLAVDGDISTVELNISATGDNPAPFASRFLADNGSITVTSNAFTEVTGDVLVQYANGGEILGGTNLASLSGFFDIVADGTLTIAGDSPASPSFSALSLTLAAQEIQIDPLASIGGNTVTLVSLDTALRNVVGGTTDTFGFTLTDAEIGAVMAEFLTIRTPVTADPNVDLELRDLNLVGSQAGGERGIDFVTDGVMQIVGSIQYSSAAISDGLGFIAGPSLQMVIPDAEISAFNDTGDLSAGLFFSADSMIFSTTDNLAIILADPLDPTIRDILNDFTATGVTGRFNYISADGVSLAATDYIYGQNTGDVDHLAGIEVSLLGEGLFISQVDPQPNDPPLSAIVYGMASDAANDAFQFDNDFFFSTEGSGNLSGPFDNEARLNDCVINTVTCPGGIPLNSDQLKEPIQDENEEEGKDAVPSTPSSDEKFGAEFPALLDAPIVQEDERVTDPVTSGGDSALYILGERPGPVRDGDEGGEE